MRRALLWQTVAAVVLWGPLANAAPEWQSLFNGKDKTGWKLRNPNGHDGWTVTDGKLVNVPHSTDLVSEGKHGDCQVHVEFMLPKQSNSGVYLQGRYEVQVLSREEKAPGLGSCGAVYSKLIPTKNVAKPNGQWQSFDLKFTAARVDAEGKKVKNARLTLVYNGEEVISDAEIDGATGGELDRKEGTPGPLMLQGDHGDVEYRNLWIRPLTEEEVARPGLLPVPEAVPAR